MICFPWMLEQNSGGSLWCKGMSSITEKIEWEYILRGEFSLLSWNLAFLSASTESFRRTYVQRPQRSTGHTELIEKNFELLLGKKTLYISFLSWLSSSCCWWHQNKLWLLGKFGIVGWIRCLFQLQILVYSGACSHFCLLHEVPPPWSAATNEGSHMPFSSLCVWGICSCNWWNRKGSAQAPSCS